jgi:hypothetical protein
MDRQAPVAMGGISVVPRPITGKEGNKIIERLTGEVTDVADWRNIIRNPT